jgi:hypothetical protein
MLIPAKFVSKFAACCFTWKFEQQNCQLASACVFAAHQRQCQLAASCIGVDF